MKKILIAGLMLLSLEGMAQKSVLSDPSLGKITITALSGQALDVDNIPLDQAIRVKLPISNNNLSKILPAGSCKIKLGFGSKLSLDPNFSLITTDLNEYFKWTAAMNGGQLQLTGELVNPLPTGIVETGLILKVKGTSLGTSTVTANFLISNHQTGITLSDTDPTNNSAYLKYTVTGKTDPALIKITNAARSSCKVNVSFTINKEVNLSRYDVEVSRDGFSYTRVAEVAATGLGGYTTGFDLSDAIKASELFVRIKSVDMDGNYQFSKAKVVSGSCDKDVSPWVLSVYPNPATDVKTVRILAKEGAFKGKYKITMLDMAGRLAQIREVQVDNVKQIDYELGNLGAGQYLLQVANSDGSQSAVLQFEKL